MALLSMFLLLSLRVAECRAEEGAETEILVGIRGSYLTDWQTALDQMNAIRREACEEGDVPDPRDPTRMLTAEEYVPLQWSAELEAVARVRAAEAAITLEHARCNGSDIFSVLSEGIGADAENLSWNQDKNAILSGIDQWYEEKADWLSRNGDAETGHYELLVDPDYVCVGLADFYTEEDVAYRSTLAGEFGRTATENTAFGEEAADVVAQVEVSSANISGWGLELTAADQITQGQTQQLKLAAEVKPADPVSKAVPLEVLSDIQYVSSDPSLASIEDDMVTGREKGEVTISACTGETVVISEIFEVDHAHDLVYGAPDVNGLVTGTCASCGKMYSYSVPSDFLLYWGADRDGSFEEEGAGLLEEGGSYYVWLCRADGDAGHDSIAVTSSNPTVAEPEDACIHYRASVTGGDVYRLQLGKAGIAALSFTPEENPAAAQTFYLRVGGSGSISLSDTEVVLDQDSYVYTGGACLPEVMVTSEGTLLEDGVDYHFFYENNTDAGTASVTIEGNGLFTGTVSKAFTISPISIEQGSLQLSGNSYGADGGSLKPAVKVRVGVRDLTEGEDFRVIYCRSIQQGKVRVTVEGIGNYSGILSAELEMQPEDIRLSDLFAGML